jgi:hypothetical protein
MKGLGTARAIETHASNMTRRQLHTGFDILEVQLNLNDFK